MSIAWWPALGYHWEHPFIVIQKYGKKADQYIQEIHGWETLTVPISTLIENTSRVFHVISNSWEQLVNFVILLALIAVNSAILCKSTFLRNIMFVQLSQAKLMNLDQLTVHIWYVAAESSPGLQCYSSQDWKWILLLTWGAISPTFHHEIITVLLIEFSFRKQTPKSRK